VAPRPPGWATTMPVKPGMPSSGLPNRQANPGGRIDPGGPGNIKPPRLMQPPPLDPGGPGNIRRPKPPRIDPGGPGNIRQPKPPMVSNPIRRIDPGGPNNIRQPKPPMAPGFRMPMGRALRDSGDGSSRDENALRMRANMAKTARQQKYVSGMKKAQGKLSKGAMSKIRAGAQSRMKASGSIG
jgi:hypothetical protein